MCLCWLLCVWYLNKQYCMYYRYIGTSHYKQVIPKLRITRDLPEAVTLPSHQQTHFYMHESNVVPDQGLNDGTQSILVELGGLFGRYTT